MSKKTDYHFKCINEDNFLLTYTVNAKSSMFNMFWEKALKKLEKKRVEIDYDFKDKIEAFNIKTFPIPDSMKILFEGQLRRRVKKLLTDISNRSGLVFYTWKLEDAIYEKQPDKDWKIKIIFKGDYAIKE